MADLSGRQIDIYRLLRQLGAGTFGEVYLAENIHDGTQVAVKVLKVGATPTVWEEFLNEARATFRLKHPHIVPLLDFGVAQETPFLVMEYAPHGTLRQRHPAGTRLPLTTIISYVEPIASALQYAHNQRLIHRDVKPSNILVGRNNTLLIIGV